MAGIRVQWHAKCFRQGWFWLLLLGLSQLTAPALVRAQGVMVPALGSASASDDYQREITESREIIRAVMAESGIPGVSVAVAFYGKVVWSEGFGSADLEQLVPVTALTKFRVGSISKAITAAGIGILIESGKLDLDAVIQEYVPEFPQKRWPITVRQVAGHTSGIRHYAGDEFYMNRRYPSVTESLEIFKDDPLLFEPGTRYSYSSYGWNLLSAVVESASERDFLSFMRDNVFEPLGMRHSLPAHTDSIIDHRAGFYQRDQRGAVLNAPAVDNSYKWAGGGFLSTPEDLVRFGTAHIGPGFLQETTLAILFKSQTLTGASETGYGVGWFTLLNERGERIVHHGGGSVGGTSLLIVNRDTGLVVAAVGNLTGGPIRTMTPRIADVFSH